MRYNAKAIGAGSEGAQSELQDSYDKVSPPFPPSFNFHQSLRHSAHMCDSAPEERTDSRRHPRTCPQSMSLQQAKVLALKVLKQVMEEKLDHNNVQLAQVRPPASTSLSSLPWVLADTSLALPLPASVMVSSCRSFRRRATRSCDQTSCRSTSRRSPRTVRARLRRHRPQPRRRPPDRLRRRAEEHSV